MRPSGFPNSGVLTQPLKPLRENLKRSPEFGGSPLLQQGEQRFSVAERSWTLICALALVRQDRKRPYWTSPTEG